MASSLSRLSASALIVIGASLVFAAGAAAQQSRDPLMPDDSTLRPWEQRLDRFYGRGDPQRETDRATRQLYDDPLHRLGIPPNQLQERERATPGAPVPTFQPGVQELDVDRNGTISREEYFRGRTPFMTPDARISSRGRRVINRLDSQFRNADRNRDGRVTPEELLETENGRF